MRLRRWPPPAARAAARRAPTAAKLADASAPQQCCANRVRPSHGRGGARTEHVYGVHCADPHCGPFAAVVMEPYLANHTGLLMSDGVEGGTDDEVAATYKQQGVGPMAVGFVEPKDVEEGNDTVFIYFLEGGKVLPLSTYAQHVVRDEEQVDMLFERYFNPVMRDHLNLRSVPELEDLLQCAVDPPFGAAGSCRLTHARLASSTAQTRHDGAPGSGRSRTRTATRALRRGHAGADEGPQLLFEMSVLRARELVGDFWPSVPAAAAPHGSVFGFAPADSTAVARATVDIRVPPALTCAATLWDEASRMLVRPIDRAMSIMATCWVPSNPVRSARAPSPVPRRRAAVSACVWPASV